MADESTHLLRSSRRGLLLLAGACCLLRSGRARAAGTAVPAVRQAELLAKAAKYDRNISQRLVGGRLKIVFASKRQSAASREFVVLAQQRIRALGSIGKYPVDIETVEIDTAGEIAPLLASAAPAIVYLSTGLHSQVPALVDACMGRSVLTVAASPQYVELGVILGFNLVNGTPELLVNLPRARANNIDFHASFLKLARIIE